MRVFSRVFKILILSLVIICIPGRGLAQKNQPVTFNGYVNTQIMTNAVSGMDRRVNPFTYRINSVFTLNTFRWKTNANFHFANKRRAYGIDLPDVNIPGYALFGLSPTYQWATFHIGNRHLHFSDYSFSGHSFYGIGMELKPGKFRLSGFYGRLKRENIDNIGLRQSLDPSFKRMGWGIKAGYENAGEYAFLSLFKASDEKPSLGLSELNTVIYPQDNAVAAITAGKKIGSSVFLEIDYSFSALSRNTLADPIETAGISLGPFKTYFGLFDPLVSSGYSKALKTKLSFNIHGGSFHIMHERIDPGYRSLGALFFNNDLENITGGGNFRMLGNRLFLSVNAGFQRNNITGKETNTLSRIVGMLSSQFRISETENLSLSYSNFSTTNTLYATSIPIIQVDSITLSQVNNQFSLSFQKSSGEKRNVVLMASLSYYRSHAIENDIVQDQQTNNNIMANLSYAHRLEHSGWSWSGGLLLNKNENEINNIFTLSPYAGISKSYFDKNLIVKSYINMVNVYLDNSYHRRILQPRFAVTYKLSDSHTVDFISYLTLQQGIGINSDQFSEFSSRLSWKARL